MTALTIVQTVAAEMNLPVPTVVFSSTDQQVIQLRNLMNRAGVELMEEGEWSILTRQTSFVTLAQEVQTAAIPSDYGWIINETMWDRTNDRLVWGPLSAEEWAREKGAPSGATVELSFRFRNNELLITPDPPAGDSIYWEYITNQWCEDSSGNGKTAMTADDDVSRLDENIVTMSLRWRMLNAKGLDYSEPYRDYENAFRKALARDGGKPRVNLARSNRFRRQLPNIPEGNWPQS